MAAVYDVIVVGGGIVGCAVVWEMTSHGYRCLLLEKNENLVSEASSGNSGMLHTGFDAAAGSLELQCIQHTYPRMFDVLNGFGLPYNKIGATMVAWSQEQAEAIPVITERCRSAGVSLCTEISLSELYRREPGLSKNAQGALWVPGETVVDPWLTAISLVHDAKRKGAEIKTNTIVQNVCKTGCDQQKIVVITSQGQFTGNVVINCGGLYGDIVDKLAGRQHFSCWITVGGIRSTGLSGSLGIADKVRNLVLNQHGLEPSGPKRRELQKISVKFLPPNHALLDNALYTVTHPITLSGIATSLSSSL